MGVSSCYVIENGESLYAVDMEVSGHKLKGDEPVSAGGKDLAPSPYDYLLAALGECTAMTLRWVANQQKWPLERVEVVVTHEKRDRKDYFTKKVIIHGNQLTEEQRQKLMDASNKCPVNRTLTSGVSIESVS